MDTATIIMERQNVAMPKVNGHITWKSRLTNDVHTLEQSHHMRSNKELVGTCSMQECKNSVKPHMRDLLLMRRGVVMVDTM